MKKRLDATVKTDCRLQAELGCDEILRFASQILGFLL